MREEVSFPVVGERLTADVWPGDGPAAVFLHAGVADRRSWRGTCDLLQGVAPLVAYDRRGYGDSPPPSEPFTHAADLRSVLLACSDGPAWLIGSSMGGRTALELALSDPDMVEGLVLFAPAVGGAPPPPVLDPATQRLSDLLNAAEGAIDDTLRLEAVLWLDGPAGPEGRVSGGARKLLMDMNRIALENAAAETEGHGSDSWANVGRLTLPVVVVWGSLDISYLIERCRYLLARIPNARHAIINDTAHLPYLERPDAAAAVIRDALTGRAQ